MTALIVADSVTLSTPVLVGAFALVSIAVGAVVGRAWVLVVPVVVAATLIAATAASTGVSDAGYGDGPPFIAWVLILGIFASIASALLGVGVLLRAVKGRWHHRDRSTGAAAH